MAFERICTMTRSRLKILDTAIAGLDDDELNFMKRYIDKKYTAIEFMTKKSGEVVSHALVSNDSGELFSDINIFEGIVMETPELLAYMEVMEVA